VEVCVVAGAGEGVDVHVRAELIAEHLVDAASIAIVETHPDRLRVAEVEHVRRLAPEALDEPARVPHLAVVDPSEAPASEPTGPQDRRTAPTHIPFPLFNLRSHPDEGG
jgi:hypothetical protein